MRRMYKLGISMSTFVFIILLGTIAYHNLERWNYVDSFYFSGITVMTVGYGDLHPTTPESKIFTVFFAAAGIAVGLVTLTFLGQLIIEGRRRAGRRFNTAVRNHHRRIRKSKREIIKGSRF
ncbi:MAG: two pore domain potassium channel family protein [Candidatus Aenigmarchaeota archaeon]|nr:two pore domain potassium channel family protein [Candidatus Aenigmarchaeota archaeon]